MNTDMKAYSLESDTFYKSITRVRFTQIKEITWYKVIHKKGDIKYKCNLFTGFKKKVAKTYDDDIIKVNFYGDVYETPIKQFAENHGYLLKDGKMFNRATVNIQTNIKDGNRTLSFDSNEEAVNYMNLIKQNCKTFNNTLI